MRSSLLRWRYIWHNAPPEIRLVLQVHDSVVGYVKDGCESVEDLCIRAMTIDCQEFWKRVYGYDLGEVELGMDQAIGSLGTGERSDPFRLHPAALCMRSSRWTGRNKGTLVQGQIAWTVSSNIHGKR